MKIRSWPLVLVAASALSLSAQLPGPSFAVASVKAVRDQRIPPMPVVFPGGRFYRPGETVAGLIAFAYGVIPFQVIGGPSWIRSDPFEIDARTEAEASRQQIAVMVQSLLEQRFGLVLRREQRTMEHSVLVVARQDGRLQPGLTKCEDPERPPITKVRIPAGALPLTGTCRPVSSIAAGVAYTQGIPVVDKTGLTGLWNYQVVYSPAGSLDAPPLPLALEEQLGLKLQTSRDPVNVLVIESVNRPTEN